ncbi:MAG: hypothetical protein ACSNEK_09035 [Parachlamydiaceae bacterium]
MSSYLNMYKYNNQFYTGTQIQPDTLSLFIKTSGKSSLYVADATAPANRIGVLPVVGSFAGIIRINNAVKEIFKPSRDSSGSCARWNAIKNLFRGLTEAIPGSGIFLILFDAMRNAIYIHSRISKQIKEQENVAGVAVDGKVIATIDLNRFKNSFSNSPLSDQKSLAYFSYICLAFLEEREKEDCVSKMTELFPVFMARLDSTIVVKQSTEDS